MFDNQMQFLNDSKPLMDQYKKRIDAVAKAAGNLSDYEAASMATWLNNTEKALNNYKRRKNLSDTTYSEVVGPFKHHAMNIISAMYTTFELKDIISIQPFTQKIGSIYHLSYTYGSNKGAVKAGDVISAGNTSPVRNGYYSTQIIKGETVTVSDVDTNTIGSLAYFPVTKPAEVTVTVVGGTGAGVYTYFATVGSTIQLQKNAGGANVATINLTTGTLTIAGNHTASAVVTANYTWNSEKYSSNAPIPKVSIGVDEILTTAERRQMLFEISLDATYDFDNQFGRNLNAEMEGAIIQQMQNELAYRVLDEMFEGADGNQGVSYTFDANPGDQKPLSQHLEMLFKLFAEMSNKIYTNLGRGRGNYIVSGGKLIEILDVLPDTIWKAEKIDTVRGPHKAGVLLGKYTIFHNPAYDYNDFIMGFKGTDWWEAPYFLGIYLPLMSSKFMMFPDMHGEQGYISMEAHEYLYKKHVVKGTITETV